MYSGRGIEEVREREKENVKGNEKREGKKDKEQE